MKQTINKESTDLIHKIENIEDEILDIKFSILKKLTPSKKNIISLKGIFKDIEVSDEEIEEAKKSLYSKIEI
jgi:hypothetical protein